MTSSHLLFIPGMIMVGMFVGFILGTRAARNQFDLQQRRQQEREAVRAERAAARNLAQVTRVEDPSTPSSESSATKP